jgi:hypothetical protein
MGRAPRENGCIKVRENDYCTVSSSAFRVVKGKAIYFWVIAAHNDHAFREIGAAFRVDRGGVPACDKAICTGDLATFDPHRVQQEISELSKTERTGF